MKDNYIQLNKDETLRLKIIDENGVETGEILTFNLDDPELLLNYQQLIEDDKKLRSKLKNESFLIDKREDVKGKKLLSKNEEDKLRLVNNFFKQEVELYNKFLGENGVQKLLNGRKFSWTTLNEIDEIIVKQIAPYLDKSMQSITNRIKQTYGKALQEQEIEVIE